MNKRGFTLVELLAVIAILAILVLVAVPNVLSMFNKAKKDVFLTDAKNIYKEISKKYITESMRGNNINSISNDNNKLDMDTSDLKYNVKLDSKGNIKSFEVSNGTYCISGKFNNLSELTDDKVKEGECDKVTVAESFESDTWETIINAVKDGDTGKYNVGDTKEIDLGSYGKHTVRIANKSTPSECSTSGFSQTACGFVIEFADIITTYKANETDTNVGGWPATSMRTFINNDIYNLLPSELKSGIIDTKVISGHSNSSEESNFTSTDKLYLLAPKEIYENWSYTIDTSNDSSRQLDYYNSKSVTTNKYSYVSKKYRNSNNYWWLRTANANNSTSFLGIYGAGSWGSDNSNTFGGISPAFRLG